MSETVKWKWWEVRDISISGTIKCEWWKDPEGIRLHNKLEREAKRGYWNAENFPPPPFDIPKELVTPLGYETRLMIQRGE